MPRSSGGVGCRSARAKAQRDRNWMTSRVHPITVRAASGDDAPRITRIYVDSWNAGFVGLMPQREVTPEFAERWRRDLTEPTPKRWWVAEQEGLAVGFAGIGPSRDPIDPNLGELDTIAVDPAHWCVCVGQTLMSVALEHLKTDGYREAILWTLAEYTRGKAFYEAAGWRLDGGVRAGGCQLRYRYPIGNLRNTAVSSLG